MVPIVVLATLIVIVVVWARRSRERYRRELAGEIAPLAEFAEAKRLEFRRLDDPGVFELAIPAADGRVVIRGYRQRDRGARLRGVVRHTELVFEADRGNALRRARLVLCVPTGELERIGARDPDDRVGRLLLVEPLLGREAARAVAARTGMLRAVGDGAVHGFTVWSDLEAAPRRVRAAEAVSLGCRAVGEVVGVPAAALVTFSSDGPEELDGIIMRVPEFVADTEQLEQLQKALLRMRAPEDGVD